ncbi:magnesium transporter CorA [Methylosinus sp. H3A]|uniref:CorA family divalent cation transporter n=1 Tax=Methylosinus sp. H3A TaxID=2785786 RepID=UPI0018C30762|nr:CorA family divalent cation transporter [Methylosinus sp. H3A]MBG0809559.1 magnesium transporter CorA [Methylosinus sp. H3A]
MKLPPSGPIVGDSPFLWVIRFDGDGAATLAADHESPQLDVEDGGYFWVHLNVADLRYRDWVAGRAQIPAEARALLIDQDGHQRLDADEAALWGVIADYGRDLEREEDVLRPLRVVVTERCIVTARRNAVESTAAIRQAALEGQRLRTPLDLFEALVTRSLGAIDVSLDRLLVKFNQIEDRVLDDEAHDERRELGALRRQTIRLRRELADGQRVFSRAAFSPRVSQPTHAALRRLTQRFDSLQQELQAAEERARLLQDEIVSNLTAETNRQLYVLTILGTLLMPPTLVSGIFGMNTKNLFFSDNEQGTLYAAAICAASAAAAYLALVWIRRRES